MSEIAKTVGQRIRSHRTKLGLNQEALAELEDVILPISVNLNEARKTQQ